MNLARASKILLASLLVVGGTTAAIAMSDDHAKPAAKPAPAAAPASDHGSGAATRTSKPVIKDSHEKDDGKPASRPSQVIESKSAKNSDKTDAKNTAKNNDKAGNKNDNSTAPTADEALAWLKEGNMRWVKGTSNHPNATAERRIDCSENGQKPFVTILTCADSRIPLERVFDRGVGDIFTIRVAGNVAGNSEGGTIEYGVEHLHTPVLVVMGHTKCGAVAAAAAENAHLEGQIGDLVNQIKPAVERARAVNPDLKDKELVTAAIRENVWQTTFGLLRNSKLLRDKAKSGQLRIVGAVYDIASGSVEFMGPHPWQSEIISALDSRDAKQMHAEAPEQDAHAEPAPAAPGH